VRLETGLYEMRTRLPPPQPGWQQVKVAGVLPAFLPFVPDRALRKPRRFLAGCAPAMPWPKGDTVETIRKETVLSLYECVLIARQDISAPQVESLAEGFSRVIEENGGRVPKREHWGLRSLTFRIKKNRKGHYVLLNIDAPAPAVQEMERQLRLSEDILRHMVVRVENLEEGPSAILQSRSGRDDRGGRREERGNRDDRPPRREDRAREDRGRAGDERVRSADANS
jgi:small subunit ribosomal protein S6